MTFAISQHLVKLSYKDPPEVSDDGRCGGGSASSQATTKRTRLTEQEQMWDKSETSTLILKKRPHPLEFCEALLQKCQAATNFRVVPCSQLHQELPREKYPHTGAFHVQKRGRSWFYFKISLYTYIKGYLLVFINEQYLSIITSPVEIFILLQLMDAHSGSDGWWYIKSITSLISAYNYITMCYKPCLYPDLIFFKLNI